MTRDLPLSALAVLALVSAPSSQCPRAALVPDDPSLLDELRYPLAVDGTTAVVGAPVAAGLCEDEFCLPGAAYVFEDAAGGWTETHKLVPSDPSWFLLFGLAVAAQGNTVLVGALGGPSVGGCTGASQGAVYVFELAGADWMQTDKLLGNCDGFGGALALDADRAAVGAPSADHPSVAKAGRVQLLDRTAGGWSPGQELYSSTPEAAGSFGTSLALEGKLLVVGAPTEASFGLKGAGAAHLYRRFGDTWQFEARLEPPVGEEQTDFGRSVALRGGRVVVGAPAAFAGGPAPAAYVFEKSSEGWSLAASLTTPDTSPGDGFGSSVAIDGGRVAVGAAYEEDGGRVAIFEEGPTGWTLTAKLAPPFPEPDDDLPLFGVGVTLRGDTLFAGTFEQGSYEYSLTEQGCPSLFGAPPALSFEAGGVHTLHLDAGQAHAGETYTVVGSFSGTSPGLTFAGLKLPLNFDAYLAFGLANPGEAPLSGSLGVLDADGCGAATFTLSSPTVPPSLAGTTLYHAWFALDPALPQPLTFASVAAPLTLLP
ncbi:MAG: hypothetical protein AAF682_20815 [Planctomycetota bacterium]